MKFILYINFFLKDYIYGFKKNNSKNNCKKNRYRL